jgi:hypothetical protein
MNIKYATWKTGSVKTQTQAAREANSLARDSLKKRARQTERVTTSEVRFGSITEVCDSWENACKPNRFEAR